MSKRIRLTYHILDSEELDNLKWEDSFTATCRNCGNIYKVNQFHKSRLEDYKRMLCKTCAKSSTYKEHTGYNWPGQNPDAIKQREDTLEKRTGYRHALQNPETLKCVEEKMLNKYNVKCMFQDRKYIEQCMINKHGVKNPNYLPSAIENRIKNYRNKTGYDWPAQNPAVRKKAKLRYRYNDIQFDSKSELYYYIYMLERGHNVIREPCYFEYEYCGKIHKYFPDFKVDGNLIEIKGSNAFKKDGTIQAIFSNDCLNKDDLDRMAEIKHQCALANGVKYIKSTDSIIAVARKYVLQKYGEFYLDYFAMNVQWSLYFVPINISFNNINPFNFIPDKNNPEYSSIGSYTANNGAGVTPFDV